jgi:two-component system chemotaxis sensor kinase CheA
VGDLADQVRALEEGLVALEGAEPGAVRDETLRAVFRAAHGLKGSARAAGFPRIEATCHAMESLLGAARDGGRVLSADDASALLAAVDALRAAQRRLDGGEEPDAAPFDAATARLNERLAATPTPPFDSAALRSGRTEEEDSVRAERGPAQPGEESVRAERRPAQPGEESVRAERSPAQPGGVEGPARYPRAALRRSAASARPTSPSAPAPPVAQPPPLLVEADACCDRHPVTWSGACPAG